ncbi:MAG: molybdopterin cofactor-binding domain-containing protein [Pseudomonadota bacterium]
MNAQLSTPVGGDNETVATATVGRRNFITYAVATPAAVAVATKLATHSDNLQAADSLTKINPYLSIRGDNKLQLTIPRVESGQGIFTSSAILVAEELGIEMKDIVVRGMDTTQAAEFTTTLQGGSGSTRCLTDPTRAAAAELKAKLKAVSGNGAITTGASGPMIGSQTFAQLAQAAQAATPAAKPYAMPWKYTGANGTGGTGLLGKGMKITGNTAVLEPGTGIPREDSAQIYTGTRGYTCDIENDALNCLVMHSLQTRGSPKEVQIAKIKQMCPKVKAVIPFNSGKNGFTIYTGVGIVCDTMGEALDARDVIMKNNLITWNPGTASRFSTPMLNQKLKDAVGTDPVASRILAAKQIKGGILVGFHHQGTLGTQTATSEVFGDKNGPATGAMAWWGSQVPKFQRHQLAEQIGLDLTPTKVVVQITPDFGHFGRNLLVDSSAESVRISDAIRKMGGLPNKKGVVTNKVKVNWSRNDDIRFAPYRPPTYSRFIANIGSDGKTIMSLNHKFVTILCEIPSGFDNTQTEAALSASNQTGFDYFPLATPSPYTFITNEAFREVVAPFPTGAMRSVYSLSAQGGKEIFLDEVARQTKQNRYAMRQKYMKSERLRTVLAGMKSEWDTQEAAVEAWNANPSNTTFRGIGFGIHEEWNSVSVVIAMSEIDRTADIATTPPKVKDVWSAIDMGKITNPSGASAQIEGAVADAVAMVYFSKITFVDGAAEQSTFLNYYWNRMRECNYTFHPARFFNVNDTRVGGAGELSAPSSFAAVANAWGHLNSIMRPNLGSHYAPEFPIYGSPTAPLTDA